MSNFWSRFFVVLSIGLGIVTFSYAQPKINSPYSRLGLGDLTNQNFAASAAMGGLGAAYNDPFHTNILNPASLSYLNATAFEVGLDAKYGRLKTDDVSQGIWSGNLSYLSLAFPLKNPINREVNPVKSPFYWGMNITLLPYSQVGYSILSEEAVPGVDTVNFDYEGSGGTFKLIWGNGFRYNNISFGLNLGYIFGKISNDRVVALSGESNSYQDLLNDEFSTRGVVWSAGVQYDYLFKEMKDGELQPNGKKITFGAYGNSRQSVRMNTSQLYRRFNPEYFSNAASSLDTIRIFNDSIMNGKLPAEFGIGVRYVVANKWNIGADFSFAGWNGYENPAKPENLVNSWRIGIGGEYIPDARSYNKYFNRVSYRFGAYYRKDPRGINEDLTDLGVSVGFGLPVIGKTQTSSVNMTFEFGQLSADNGLSELYGRFTVGFTLNNNQWFLKRKFY